MPRKSKSIKAKSRLKTVVLTEKEETTSAPIGATSFSRQTPTAPKTKDSPKSTDTTPQAGTQESKSSNLPKTPPTLESKGNGPTNEEIRAKLKQITIDNLSIYMSASIQVMRSYGMPDDFIKKVMAEAVVLMNATAQSKSESRNES